MALLTGMTPDGTEVPVQVDPSGRLVAEGLTGPQGAPGSPAQLGGTATAPGLTPPGDTNTGIYSPGADQLAISTGGTRQLVILSDGKVGLGAASVLQQGYGVDGGSGAGVLELYNGGTGNTTLENTGASPILFKTNGSERLRITSAGLVGVGTSSPGEKITIAGTSGSAAIGLLETGVRNWAIRAGGAVSNSLDVADLTAGATRLTINSSGNVGIGTTAARSLFHASGTISANDGVDIQSPDGSWWSVTVTDAGALTVARSTTTTSGVS